jgi:hypothetical protein
MEPMKLESQVRRHFPLSTEAVIDVHRLYQDGATDRVIDGSEATLIVPARSQAGFFRTKPKSVGNDASTRRGHGDEQEFCALKYLGGVAFYVPDVQCLTSSGITLGQLTCNTGRINFSEYKMQGF